MPTDKLIIDTPEQVHLEFVLAGIGSRFMATFLDVLIEAVLYLVLFLLTLIVLGITTLCVTSNFSEMVLERSREIGILKALGAVERGIAALFVSESAALALAATIAGYAVGLFAAAAIAREVFGAVFRLDANWLVFAGVAGVMLAVAAIASTIAASRIWNIQPAIVLRGE